MQGYSENLYIYKILNIYKPVIRTCTVDNLNPLPGTYIQYRSDKDSSYNDNKSILKIGTYDKRISSKDYYVTLDDITFKITIENNAESTSSVWYDTLCIYKNNDDYRAWSVYLFQLR